MCRGQSGETKYAAKELFPSSLFSGKIFSVRVWLRKGKRRETGREGGLEKVRQLLGREREAGQRQRQMDRFYICSDRHTDKRRLENLYGRQTKKKKKK